MRSRSRPAGLIAALVAVLTLAAPAAAASPWVTFSQSGTVANADTQHCADNPDGTVTCSGESLSVFEGKIKAPGERARQGDVVCYNRFSFTFDPISGEPLDDESVSGCTFDAGTLSIDNLTSVTLDPTLVELVSIDCTGESECTETPAGSTTVHGTWTGTGPITQQSGKFRVDDGTCVQMQAERASFRDASFEGSFDTTSAGLSSGTFTMRTSCAF